MKKYLLILLVMLLAVLSVSAVVVFAAIQSQTVGWCPETTEEAAIKFNVSTDRLQRDPQGGCGWIVTAGSPLDEISVPSEFQANVPREPWSLPGPTTTYLLEGEQLTNWLVGLPYPEPEFQITSDVLYVNQEGTFWISGDQIPEHVDKSVWQLGDGAVYTSTIPADPIQHVYTETGTFTISVGLFNMYDDMVYSVVDEVEVIEPQEPIYIPNWCPETAEQASIMFSVPGSPPIPIERLDRDSIGGCGWIVIPGEQEIKVFAPIYYLMMTSSGNHEGPYIYTLPVGEQITNWLTGLPYPVSFSISNDILYSNEEGSLWISGDPIPEPVTTALWEFGDGEIFTSTNPADSVSHTYIATGTYTVTVELWDDLNNHLYDARGIVEALELPEEPIAFYSYLPLIQKPYVDPFVPFLPTPVRGYCPGDLGYPQIWELVGGSETDWERIDAEGCGFRIIRWWDSDLPITVQDGMEAQTLDNDGKLVIIVGQNKVWTDEKPFSVWIYQWWP